MKKILFQHPLQGAHGESSSSGERPPLGSTSTHHSVEIDPSVNQLSVPLKRHGSLNATPTSLANNEQSPSPSGAGAGAGGSAPVTPIPPVGGPNVNNDPSSTPTDLSIKLAIETGLCLPLL